MLIVLNCRKRNLKENPRNQLSNSTSSDDRSSRVWWPLGFDKDGVEDEVNVVVGSVATEASYAQPETDPEDENEVIFT